MKHAEGRVGICLSASHGMRWRRSSVWYVSRITCSLLSLFLVVVVAQSSTFLSFVTMTNTLTYTGCCSLVMPPEVGRSHWKRVSGHFVQSLQTRKWVSCRMWTEHGVYFGVAGGSFFVNMSLLTLKAQDQKKPNKALSWSYRKVRCSKLFGPTNQNKIK